MKIVVNKCYGGFSISKEAAQWLLDNNIEEPFKSIIQKNLSKDRYYGYIFTDYENRTHPLLVRCIEELGEEASDKHSCLCIEEVEGKYYMISDYDGIETITTPNLNNFIKSPYE